MTRRQSHAARAGFTFVEIMVALAVLTVGAMGLMRLQTATTGGNQQAREISTATAIARNWVDRIKRDATRWTGTTALELGQTAYLQQAAGAWFVPAPDPTDVANEAPAADYYGFDTVTVGDAYYCTNLSNTVVDTTPAVPGPASAAAIRVDVRVWWLARNKTGDAPLAQAALWGVVRGGAGCNAPPAAADLDAGLARTVFASTLVSPTEVFPNNWP